MKKVLFLLLVTSISYGQALFDKGVKITGGQTTTTVTNKIISQEANGVLNQINATSLPISTATANALDLRTENSSGAIQGFAITNNGNGTVNIATGTAYLRQTNDPYSAIIKYVIPAVTNLSLTDNANNFVLVDYNGGSPSLTVTTSPGTINTTTNSIAYLISRVGTTLDYISLVGQNVDANGKLRRRLLNIESLRRAQGAVLTSSNRNLLVTSGLFYSGLTEVTTPLFNTSTVDTFTQVYINGTWTRSTGNTQVNNTQYSLAGVLTAMPTNDYRVDYVYLLADNPSKLYVLLGTTTYNNITSARLSPVPVDLPSELQYLGTRIGRVIIQKNATTMETSSEYATIYQAGSAQLHNDLGGLNLGDFQHLTVAEKANLEVITNKTSTLSPSTTLYPNNDAVISALALKQNTLTNPITGTGTTNTFPIFTGSTTQGNSIVTQTGTRLVNIIGTGAGAFGDFGLNIRNTTSGFRQAATVRTENNAGNFGIFGKTNVGFTAVKTISDQDYFFYNSNLGNMTFLNDFAAGKITFTAGASSTAHVTIHQSGNTSFGTSTDNGQGVGQFNGTVTASPATLSNQVVVKSQLDLKADLASPTFTGVPSVPTATAGTNTTQIASTAFVFNNTVSTLLPQSITGTKTFVNNSEAHAIYVANNSSSAGLTTANNSTGIGYQNINFSSGLGQYLENRDTGVLSVWNSATASTSDLLRVTKQGVLTAKINHLGESTLPKITMTGTIELKAYTVATLPTGVQGATAYVTDALAPAYLGTLTGGGTVKAPVFYDGTVWRSTINAIDTNNIVYKTGNQTITGQKSFENNSTDSNIVSSNYSSGTGIQSFNSSSGDGIFSNNTSTGTAINSVNFSTGKNLVLNNSLEATGTPFTIQKSNVDKLTINDNGEITGNKYIKTGGTSLQFLKADGSVDGSDVVKNIAKDATQGANITGTVSETILYSKLIPANTFKDGDFMNLFSRVGKSLQLGTLNNKVKINTSNTLTGAVTIASNFAIETNRIFNIFRTFTVSNGFLTGFSGTVNASSDIINNTNPPQFNVFDPTVDNYIFVTGQLSNSADTMYHLGTKITN